MGRIPGASCQAAHDKALRPTLHTRPLQALRGQAAGAHHRLRCRVHRALQFSSTPMLLAPEPSCESADYSTCCAGEGNACLVRDRSCHITAAGIIKRRYKRLGDSSAVNGCQSMPALLGTVCIPAADAVHVLYLDSCRRGIKCAIGSKTAGKLRWLTLFGCTSWFLGPGQ